MMATIVTQAGQEFQHTLKQRHLTLMAQQAGWQLSSAWRGYIQFLVICPASGRRSLRYKALPSTVQADKPKCLWPKGGQNGVRYYAPQGQAALIEAIAAQDGRLIIASGEPDLLSLLSAGLRNVLCWFGELSLPKSLKTDLLAWGVRHITYYHDNDQAGHRSAEAVARAWGQPITVATPEACKDVNELLILLKGDAQAMLAQLRRRETVLEPPAPQPRPQPAAAQPQSRRGSAKIDYTALRLSVTDAVVSHAQRGRWRGSWFDHRSLFRDDQHASASYNADSGIYYDRAAGSRWSLSELAEALGLRPDDFRRKPQSKTAQTPAPDWPPQELQPIHRPRVTSDDQTTLHELNAPFISQALGLDQLWGRVSVIESPTGSGKTCAARRWIDELQARYSQQPRTPRILYVAHRASLVSASAHTLGLETYRSLAHPLRRAERLAITLDSLHKLMDDRGRMPTFDLVLLDESDQLAQHLGRRSTLKGQHRIRAWLAFKGLLGQGHTLVFMDAHAGRLTHRLARIPQRPVSWWRNLHQPQLGQITLYDLPDPVLRGALARAQQAHAPVALGLDSRKRAEEVACLARQQGIPHLLITAHTQDDPQVKDFLDNPNQQLQRYRLLIFSPSISTGFDIQAQLDSLWFVAQGQHLGPQDVLQALRRFRRAPKTHLHLRRHQRFSAPQPRLALDQAQHLTQLTDPLLPWPLDQAQTRTAAQLSALHAITDYHHASARRDTLAQFWGLALEEGYKVAWLQRLKDQVLRQSLRQARTQLDALLRQNVLQVTYALSPQHYRSRRDQGRSTPDDAFALLRGQIEMTRYASVSETIGAPSMTAQDYDLLHSVQQRDTLRRIALFLAGEQAALQRDSHEQTWAWQERQHHWQAHQALHQLLRLFSDGSPELSAAELEDAALPWIERQRGIIAWVDRQAGAIPAQLSDDPIATVRRFLARYGLRLTSVQRRREGQRGMFYSLEQTEEQRQLWAWAEERNRWLERLETSEDQQIPCQTNVDAEPPLARLLRTYREPSAQSGICGPPSEATTTV